MAKPSQAVTAAAQPPPATAKPLPAAAAAKPAVAPAKPAVVASTQVRNGEWKNFTTFRLFLFSNNPEFQCVSSFFRFSMDS